MCQYIGLCFEFLSGTIHNPIISFNHGLIYDFVNRVRAVIEKRLVFGVLVFFNNLLANFGLCFIRNAQKGKHNMYSVFRKLLLCIGFWMVFFKNICANFLFIKCRICNFIECILVISDETFNVFQCIFPFGGFFIIITQINVNTRLTEFFHMSLR